MDQQDPFFTKIAFLPALCNRHTDNPSNTFKRDEFLQPPRRVCYLLYSWQVPGNCSPRLCSFQLLSDVRARTNYPFTHQQDC